jgi:hypothetical protein
MNEEYIGCDHFKSIYLDRFRKPPATNITMPGKKWTENFAALLIAQTNTDAATYDRSVRKVTYIGITIFETM